VMGADAGVTSAASGADVSVIVSLPTRWPKRPAPPASSIDDLSVLVTRT
jgi:hypothetical protein